MIVGMMSATFSVEGSQRASCMKSDGDEPPLPVDVELVTDGQFVMIQERYGKNDYALTPQGWYDLSVHAKALVGEARRAWADMGATGPR